jgi:hypothetical protein
VARVAIAGTPEKGKPIARWGRKVTGLAQQSLARQRDRQVLYHVLARARQQAGTLLYGVRASPFRFDHESA